MKCARFNANGMTQNGAGHIRNNNLGMRDWRLPLLSLLAEIKRRDWRLCTAGYEPPLPLGRKWGLEICVSHGASVPVSLAVGLEGFRRPQ